MVCGAIGLCSSLQAALAQANKQLLSNEIPQVDLSQKLSPLLLNVPGLLYPQQKSEQDAVKPDPPKPQVFFI